MSWNYRIMRRYPPESPENYYYDIVEVIYGEDGRPMMWTETTLPQVSDLDLDLENDHPDFDEDYFVRESLKMQFSRMAQDIDARAPLLDEHDFEPGGIYADHPDMKKFIEVAKAYEDGDEEALEEYGLIDIDIEEIRKRFAPDEDDEDDATSRT